MCLTSKWRFPKRANEDIVCYKVLECVDKPVNSSVYYTPYMGTPVEVPGNLKAEGCRFRSPFNAKDVTLGYIHAYVGLRSAVFLSRNYFDDIKTIIVKCIIHPGTKYHLSANNIEICATEMEIVETIPSYILSKYYNES